jgi:hypothetical protein
MQTVLKENVELAKTMAEDGSKNLKGFSSSIIFSRI